jgi:Uma2 family endonuclease
MLERTYPIPQREDTPLPPREMLPTMYDLLSENPEEPGLPDEYHDLQAQVLSHTCRPRRYFPQELFCGSDINLYYDAHHSLWYKRPDWFVAVGVPRLYDGTDLRMSYVVWQEGVAPCVVVEFLSPGTTKEDLGEGGDEEVEEDGGEVEMGETQGRGDTETQRRIENPKSKWEVYEQILQIPYYVVFNRYSDRLRWFKLDGGQYREQPLDLENPRIWIPELELGLGLWQGEYEGISRRWLRWFDREGNWVPTDAEAERQRAETERQRAEAERQRAETERQRAEQVESQLQQVIVNLLRSGMSVEEVAALTGVERDRVQRIAER